MYWGIFCIPQPLGNGCVSALNNLENVLTAETTPWAKGKGGERKYAEEFPQVKINMSVWNYAKSKNGIPCIWSTK